MSAPKTTLEILRAARELIATPERWTKGWYARDTEGRGVFLHDLAAGLGRPSCYCLDGAFIAVSKDSLATSRMGLAAALGFHWLEDMYIWQDAEDRTHAEVLARLDAAIQAEEAKVVK